MLQISCVLRKSGTSFIQHVISLYTPMFIHIFRPGEVKIYPEAVIFVSDSLLSYINPSHDWDARRWVKVLPLFLLSLPCVFDNHHTNQ